ncbi:RHG15-like protein [Mya arenaria]|uniref:RHG15-like protein n=1 Tax=Mya arenaria TaxID=6604 RepID=A0ABY7DEC1_MYAAR|nr:RHG15-like protein [Mya arenaria]
MAVNRMGVATLPRANKGWFRVDANQLLEARQNLSTGSGRETRHKSERGTRQQLSSERDAIPTITRETPRRTSAPEIRSRELMHSVSVGEFPSVSESKESLFEHETQSNSSEEEREGQSPSTSTSPDSPNGSTGFFLAPTPENQSAQLQQSLPRPNQQVVQRPGSSGSRKIDSRAQSMYIDVNGPATRLQSEGGSASNESLNSNCHLSVNINEPIEGNLNKCRLLNGGKKNSKKWSMNFAKLDGSNLVFYVRKKDAQPTKDSPHGKPETIVPLIECQITKESTDYTSKKNTFVLTTSDSMLLLQADNETVMQEWFLKIHTRIAELGGTPDMPSTDSSSMDRKGKIKNALDRFLNNRSDKRTLETKGIIKDAIFGGDIKQICSKEKSKVPIFVVKCIDAIEKRGLNHEGIYRIAGSMSQIQKLRCMVDQGERYDLEDEKWDVHMLCGTLKLFFRELKDPLFTYALFENVMDLQRENKMAAHQLAIVFGPTLIWPETSTMNLATSMVYQSQIVEFVLLEYKNIFR